MDIGTELRVIEVEEPAVEPVEMEPIEVEAARSRPAGPGHTKS